MYIILCYYNDKTLNAINEFAYLDKLFYIKN